MSPALLRCSIGGHDAPIQSLMPDRVRQLGERPQNPLGTWYVDGEFVMAAAQVLHEGMPADDQLGDPAGSESRMV